MFKERTQHKQPSSVLTTGLLALLAVSLQLARAEGLSYLPAPSLKLFSTAGFCGLETMQNISQRPQKPYLFMELSDICFSFQLRMKSCLIDRKLVFSG